MNKSLLPLIAAILLMTAAPLTAADISHGKALKEMDATTETACTLRTCYTIFSDQNDARAREVLEVACNQLNRRAATIDDPEQVARFWQLADHRFFREAARVRDASDRA